MTRDLTARRQAEETERTLVREQAARAAAEAIASRAAEANRIKDEFLATVSHELRTPLNAIVGWTSILRRRPLEPEIVKAIDVIDRNARTQVRIIDDILDVSRIITGKLRIEQRPADLIAITKDAIEVVRPAAAAKQITIEFVHADPEELLVGDPDRLQQVIWNLLSNAVKFTEAGGTIRITVVREGSQLTLTVADTGRGIDPEFLPFVFDRFKQADASTSRRVGGLGLGLAIVRSLVELHGGTVAVDSAGPGKGSTFSVTLPIRAVQLALPAEQRAAERVVAVAPERPQALQGLRVLVVDDDEDARVIVSMVLGAAGAEVKSAASAQQGLAALREFPADVLVSDIGMPNEDGYSLIRRVRALDPAGGRVDPGDRADRLHAPRGSRPGAGGRLLRSHRQAGRDRRSRGGRGRSRRRVAALMPPHLRDDRGAEHERRDQLRGRKRAREEHAAHGVAAQRLERSAARCSARHRRRSAVRCPARGARGARTAARARAVRAPRTAAAGGACRARPRARADASYVIASGPCHGAP